MRKNGKILKRNVIPDCNPEYLPAHLHMLRQVFFHLGHPFFWETPEYLPARAPANPRWQAGLSALLPTPRYPGMYLSLRRPSPSLFKLR